MPNLIRKLIGMLLVFFVMAAPGPGYAAEEVCEADAQESLEVMTDGLCRDLHLVVRGANYRPEAAKVIVTLDHEVSQMRSGDPSISLQGIPYEITAVYLSDSEGTPLADTDHSEMIAFDLGYPLDGAQTEASLVTINEWGLLTWVDEFVVSISDPNLYLDGEACALSITADLIDHRICPDSDLFQYRSYCSGEYSNSHTGETETRILQMAAYEPESLAGGEQNPLIIWLHGFEEGGWDLDMVILNDGTHALAKDEIQSYFTTGDVTGAYVLLPQCPTFWMDEGDAAADAGSGISAYTECLRALILQYLSDNEDADPTRIYIGGASNGAYMTINMLNCYPELFAAAFPVCGGYSYYTHAKDSQGHVVYMQFLSDSTADSLEQDPDRQRKPGTPVRADLRGAVLNETVWFTKEKVDRVRTVPIWFVSSVDDSVLAPWEYVLPDYCALIQGGAEHCFLSMFESYGHAVWTAVMQDKVSGVQETEGFQEMRIPDMQKAATELYPLMPDDAGGGTRDADGFQNLFAWLNSFRLEKSSL